MSSLLPERVNAQIELAKAVSHSSLLPRQYQGQPANLLWAIQYAESIGVHPMVAVTGIHVIEGKPSASAQLIGGLVRRAGHKLRVTFDGATGTATARVIRADDPEFVFESVWTMARAKAAGLTGKKVWQQYPDAMLKARAITEVARDACPEALFGVVYTPEELGADDVDVDGDLVPSVTVTQLSPVADDPFVVPVDSGDAASDAQLRKIHAAARTLGLSDDKYRAGLEKVAGVRSSKELTKASAAKVIDALEAAIAREGLADVVDAETVDDVEDPVLPEGFHVDLAEQAGDLVDGEVA